MTKCVHCLKNIKGKITRDHVFPSGWYTDDTPLSVQRWVVPCCRECNAKFGALEEDLFLHLAPCIDPQKLQASGITQKLMRSFGLTEDLPENEETLIRRKRAAKIFAKTQPYSKDIQPLPNLGLHEGFAPESHRMIKVPDSLVFVLEKILRGCEYKMGERYIEDPYKLEVYPTVYEEPKDVKLIMEKFGNRSSLGPGFIVERASGQEAVMYKVEIWGTLIFYASIDHVDYSRHLNSKNALM